MNWKKEDSYFKETTASSELIFDGKVLHLYKDMINLPDGKESMREYCKHNGAVAVVPLTNDGCVVCVRQYRYALDRVTLEIPAGKFDFVGEDHREAALRELREETGYTPGKLTDIGPLATSPALLTEIIYMYLAEDMIEGATDPDPDEFLEIVKIPLAEMVDMILRGEIQDAKTQAAVLKVWALKQNGLVKGSNYS
ncbi:MAG: NUDIX hydrolase [Clostridia bacterium]|jgi:ADP-ribose pyrophosphatase|nr:NUDIX hydrolase [Clostridia bacterium]